MEGRPTIKDVARKANVSPTTVSRVLNGDDANHMRPETKQRVLQALEELGYVPNKAARALRRRLTGVIALLLPDVSNPFFACLARGVAMVAFQHNTPTLICDSEHCLEKEIRYLEILMKESVDGLIYIPVGRPDEEKLQRLFRFGIKIVFADRRVEGWPTIEADNFGGAYQLTRYVLSLGYSCIAYIAGPPNVSTAQDRLNGFSAAMEESGKTPVEIVYGDFTFEAGYNLARQILDRHSVDAILCGNDLMAIGSLYAAKELGISVPRDLGIAGFDQIAYANLVHPPLTTARVPAFEIGREAANTLFANSEIQSKKLDVEIIHGGTCVPRR
ncbi:MAG: LacI family DNA-binding transcriptional regulator [Clostridia bacterium]|nr:LacI family DNA-binding transcriptional regulator [Clostridia bacterium]